MKRASIYERKGKIYVRSSSQTTTGLWMGNAHALAVDGEDISAIGSAIRECLMASRENIAHPSSFTNIFNPTLKLAGVRSYSAFAKLAKLVQVSTCDDKVITFTPMKNGGVTGDKRGFTELNHKIEENISSDRDVGLAAKKALLLSE
jgi:hypothetical protein